MKEEEEKDEEDEDDFDCRHFFFFVVALVLALFVAFIEETLHIFGGNVGTNVLVSKAWQRSRQVL